MLERGMGSRLNFPDNPFDRSGATGSSARWIAVTFALTAVAWFTGLSGLLSLANRVHVDIPQLLAVRLPLLQSSPRLIFAGESRTEYGVDPVLAAKLRGESPGYAVNVAYDAGEPLAVAAAARNYPEVFRRAHVVVSVAPFIFNEGVRSASVYPLDVAARLSVGEQLATFLPLRVGTLIRYISEAFAARLAQQQDIARLGSMPPNGGLVTLNGAARGETDLDNHRHYANWNIVGPKSRDAVAALCEIAAASDHLTVVNPPWIPGDRSQDTVWAKHEADIVALLTDAGKRCGFDVLNIVAVPGLDAANYADEMHVNASGVPVYTRYLMSQLKR
jgi:hypothetical protein